MNKNFRQNSKIESNISAHELLRKELKQFLSDIESIVDSLNSSVQEDRFSHKKEYEKS